MGAGVDGVFATDGQMARLMAGHDWAATPLGAPADWSPALRTTVAMLLRSRFPMILSWGDDLVMLYNDPFLPVLGEKHPQVLGARLQDGFAEVWDEVGPMQRGVLAGGPAIWMRDLRLAIERGDGPEEAFFTFSYSHVPDDTGPGGVLAVLGMTTPEVVAARRMALLDRLARATAGSDDPDEVLVTAARLLDDVPEEVALAGLYLRDDGGPLRLVARAGAPGHGQPALPAGVEPGDDDGLGLARALVGPDRVRTELPSVPGDGRPREAVAIPMPHEAGDGVRGVLLVAPAALRPVDAASQEFLGLLADHLCSAVAAARARRDEQERLAALAALHEARSTLLQTISHEFRTPLTLALGPLDDVVLGRRDDLDADELRSVHTNVHRLGRLVDTLLDMARDDAGRLEAATEPVDAATLTRTLVDDFRPALQRAGLGLHVEVDDTGPVVLDPFLWERAVLNLLSNAVKYTPAGRVEVRLRTSGDELVLEVADTGPGVAEQDRERIFQRFERTEHVDGRSIEGLGIGLAVVADAARLHGGTAEVGPGPEGGSRFRVRLPLVRAEGPSTSDPAGMLGARRALVDDVRSWRDTDGDRGPAPDDERPCVLVVDDHPELRRRVADLLAAHWRVVTAPDGREALSLAARLRPAAVVTDVMMPHVDGLQLLATLREDPRTSDVPVLLLTARAGPGASAEALDAGADDYVTKPFHPEELRARVRTAVELAALRRRLAATRVRDVLLAGVSHDMQTPVTAVLGALELLGDPRLEDERRRQLLALAQRRTAQLRRLVTQFLDWARIAAGQPLPVETTTFDPLALVHGAVATSASGARVEVATPPPPVVGDPLRSEQALHNLLENAEKVSSSVVVRVDVADGRVVVDVEDDGPGVPPERVERLFEAWVHDDGPARRGHPGTGLGLHVSRATARAQGGDLELLRTGPGGSVFRLSVPVAPT